MTSKPSNRSEILKEKGSLAASFDEDENDDNNNEAYPRQNEKQSPATAALMEEQNNDVEDPTNKEKGSVPPPLRRGRDVSASSRPGAFAQPGINDMNHSGHQPRNNSITSDIERGEVETQQDMPEEETADENRAQNTCATSQQSQPPAENTTDPVVPSQDFLIMATLVEDPPPLIYQITEATAVTLESEEDLDPLPPRDEGSARSITKTHAPIEGQCNRRLLLMLIVVIGVLVVAGFVVLLVLLLKGESGGDSNNNNGNTENADYADTYASQPTDNSATDPAWFARQEHVSFHAVQYRSEIPTDCLVVSPAALTLSCEGVATSSVLVVNTGSTHVQCERQNDNAIACHVVSSENPEFILLAACGGDDSDDENAQTLKAHLAERELTDCGVPSTTQGSTTVYTSHAYQSLAVGQFCFDQDEGNKSDPFDDTEDSMQFMMEPNSCLHGHEEPHTDQDSTELVCYQTSSCQAAWTCQGNNDCSGDNQCDHTLGEVEAKDPRMGCSSMTMDDMDEDEMMEMAKEKMNRQRHQTRMRRTRRISS